MKAFLFGLLGWVIGVALAEGVICATFGFHANSTAAVITGFTLGAALGVGGYYSGWLYGTRRYQ